MEEIKKTLKEHKSLSRERTLLAIERNTLSYIRKGFECFVFGIGLIKLFFESVKAVSIGYFSIAVGFMFIFIGIINQNIRKKRVSKID